MENEKSKECDHVWNYEIKIMENSNIYIENCFKCLKTIKTHELFKE
jgi:hypothetical protein